MDNLELTVGYARGDSSRLKRLDIVNEGREITAEKRGIEAQLSRTCD